MASTGDLSETAMVDRSGSDDFRFGRWLERGYQSYAWRVEQSELEYSLRETREHETVMVGECKLGVACKAKAE